MSSEIVSIRLSDISVSEFKEKRNSRRGSGSILETECLYGDILLNEKPAKSGNYENDVVNISCNAVSTVGQDSGNAQGARIENGGLVSNTNSDATPDGEDPETVAMCETFRLYATQGAWERYKWTKGLHEDTTFEVEVKRTIDNIDVKEIMASSIRESVASSSRPDIDGKSTTSSRPRSSGGKTSGSASKKSTRAKKKSIKEANGKSITVTVYQEPASNLELGITGGRVWDAAIVTAKLFEELFSSSSLEEYLRKYLDKADNSDQTTDTIVHPLSLLWKTSFDSQQTSFLSVSLDVKLDKVPLEVKPWTIIELGSGTGLSGLGCAACAPPGSTVIISDQERHRKLLQKNVDTNANVWEKNNVDIYAKTIGWGKGNNDQVYREIADIIIKKDPSLSTITARSTASSTTPMVSSTATDMAANETTNDTCAATEQDNGQKNDEAEKEKVDTSKHSPQISKKIPVDLVFASDVIYHEDVILLLVQTLVELFYPILPKKDPYLLAKTGLFVFELRSSAVTEFFLARMYENFDVIYLQKPKNYDSGGLVVMRLTAKVGK